MDDRADNALRELAKGFPQLVYILLWDISRRKYTYYQEKFCFSLFIDSVENAEDLAGGDLVLVPDDFDILYVDDIGAISDNDILSAIIEAYDPLREIIFSIFVKTEDLPDGSIVAKNLSFIVEMRGVI